VCGICGLGGRDPSVIPITAQAIRAMTDVIRHRGPDDEGWLLRPGVALGARRLSIIDLPGGHQPIANEDETVWTVFNGEIYNFRELRRELLKKGHRFTSHSDTETIVHLYEEEGSSFARHLRGMFAVALWDVPNRRLVLARDRMGVKPLYLAQTSAGLAFASELKALITGSLIQPRLDPVGAELFGAFGYVPGPATLLSGVTKLDPASYLVWENGAEVNRSVYWTPFDNPPSETGHDWREDEQHLLELLRKAVRSRLVADVPLGVMLSGGLDSSLVTALMAEASTEPVQTFSIGFAEDGTANELADARRVADRLGTTHHELLTSARDHPQLLDEALWHLEDPIADLSCLGFLLLSRLARQHVKVALSGQGADELLGGYRKHQVAWAADLVARLPEALRRRLASSARVRSSAPLPRGILAITTDDPAVRFLAMSRVIDQERRETLYKTGLLHDDAEEQIADVVYRHLPNRRTSILQQVLHLDAETALVDNMLLYFDKMSMATSLEVRVPFMDHDVVSFCATLPASRRISLLGGLKGKEILRRASRGLVSEETLAKKKRGFFRSAVSAWIRTNYADLVQDVLLDERTLDRGLYRPDAIKMLVDPRSPRWFRKDQTLLALILLEKWQRLFVDGDAIDEKAFRPQRSPAGSLNVRR
jgi:asparagine synthase (glutamine-hydrolysing)